MKTFLKWALIGLGGLVLLVVLFYAEEDWRGWHAWNQFKHKWEAKGIKFDYSSIVPPKVPDDQNFAMSPVWIAEIKYLWQENPKQAAAWYGDRINDEAVSKLIPQLPVNTTGVTGKNSTSIQPPAVSGNWATAHAVNLAPWQSFYRELARTNPAADISVAAQPQSPAADVLLALGKFDPAIEQLRQDAAMTDSRFPVIYATDNPAEILLPHLAIVKRYSQVLQLRAVAELQNGQPDKALSDVKLMLRLTDSVRNEPFLITHLVRIAILNMVLQPVWEGLAAHQWSDAQLTELDAELAKLDFLTDYQMTMRGEMVFQISIIDYLRRHPAKISEVTGNGNSRQPTFPLQLALFMLPRGWYVQNQLHCARPMMEFFLPLADTNHQTVSPAACRRADAAVQKETRHRNAFNFAERWLTPALSSAVRRFAYAQETADLARVAIALERSRLAHGEYPVTLDTIEPRFMDKVPPDIINGQPLHYRVDSGGKFTLYSVGWNETDDGGKVNSTKGGAVDNMTGDWVWQN